MWMVTVGQLPLAFVGRLVDVDELMDADGVAKLLGLGTRNAARVYRGRYPDFPEPVWSSEGGRCRLWVRSEVDEWRQSHPAR